MVKRQRVPKPPPIPIKIDSRNCFGIAYLQSEDDAEAYAAHVARRGHTYNGGFFHGKPCGREKTWDYLDPKLGPLYAVTN